MLGNLVILAVSYGILRYFGLGFAALGFDQPARRAAEFGAGFVVAGLVIAGQQLGLAALLGYSWEPVPGYALSTFLEALRWDFNSVIYEELLFRGVLLLLAVHWLGAKRAIWLGAIVFGIYHPVNWGVFQPIVWVVWIIIVTGSAGLMYCTAFVRTGSLALPIGLHFGWNAVGGIVFSGGAIGEQMYRAVGVPDDAPLLLQIGMNLLLPVGYALAVILFLLKVYPKLAEVPVLPSLSREKRPASSD